MDAGKLFVENKEVTRLDARILAKWPRLPNTGLEFLLGLLDQRRT